MEGKLLTRNKLVKVGWFWLFFSYTYETVEKKLQVDSNILKGSFWRYSNLVSILLYNNRIASIRYKNDVVCEYVDFGDLYQTVLLIRRYCRTVFSERFSNSVARFLSLFTIYLLARIQSNTNMLTIQIGSVSRAEHRLS